MSTTVGKASSLNEVLLKYSRDEIENFKAFRSVGERIADDIFRALKVHPESHYKIDRVRIAGSIGKRSSLGVSYQPDFDLVVFVNDQIPPFEKVLDEFQKVIEDVIKHNPEFEFKGRTPHAIQFAFKKNAASGDDCKEYEFDLLPAANLVGDTRVDNTTHERYQTTNALEAISKFRHSSGSEAFAYGSSLCEPIVTFVKSQSDLVHDVIRLAKLWNQGVTWEGSKMLSGRSMIMELVATFVANKVELDSKIPKSEQVSVAVRRFLEKFLDFDKNMVVYFQFKMGKDLSKAYQAYLGLTTSPKAPLILDPFNPFNNMASNFSQEMKAAFALHADNTLEAMKNYTTNDSKLKTCFTIN